MDTIVTKKCTKCGEIKPIDAFAIRSGTIRRGVCKVCNAPQRKAIAKRPYDKIYPLKREWYIAKAKNWYAENKERKQAYDRVRRNKLVDKLRELHHAYYEAHKEEHGKRNRAYFANHREQMRGYNRKWKRGNADKVNENTRNRRARIRGNGGVFTKDEWLEILEKYEHKCLRCGGTIRIEADHVIPIAKGGMNVKENIQPLCRNCNARKNDDIADYRPVGGI